MSNKLNNGNGFAVVPHSRSQWSRPLDRDKIAHDFRDEIGFKIQNWDYEPSNLDPTVHICWLREYVEPVIVGNPGPYITTHLGGDTGNTIL